jgi:hypothetical protein
VLADSHGEAPSVARLRLPLLVERVEHSSESERKRLDIDGDDHLAVSDRDLFDADEWARLALVLSGVLVLERQLHRVLGGDTKERRGTIRLLASTHEDRSADVIGECGDVLRQLPPLLRVNAFLEVQGAPLRRVRDRVEVGTAGRTGWYLMVSTF